MRIQRDGPMRLYFDNKAAIDILHKPGQHQRMKHIKIDIYFIKKKLDSVDTSTDWYTYYGLRGSDISEYPIRAKNEEYLFITLRGSVESRIKDKVWWNSKGVINNIN